MKPLINAFFYVRRLLTKSVLAVSVLVICVPFLACTRSDDRPAGPPEKITFAFSATTDAVLAAIAQANGYFRQEGLEVTPHLHPYGKPALEDLLAGKADFATVAETPVMFAVMKGEKVSVIATIQNSNTGNAILARTDRGILTLEDLKGKRIAATLGTTSDFFLDAILSLHGISRKDVEVVDLKAVAMADALDRGDIDAVSTFTPYVAITRNKLGNLVTTFQDKDIYRWTFNVVASQEFIRNNPGKVKKVLRALARAEEFVKENPAASQKIVADFSSIGPGIVREIWPDTSFALTLDQPLILALEDETEWAIKNRLIKATKVPNYLNSVYLDGLKAIKPGAVRILK